MAVTLKKIKGMPADAEAEQPFKVAPTPANDAGVQQLAGALQAQIVDSGLEAEIEALGLIQEELEVVDPVRAAKIKDYNKRCAVVKAKLIELGLVQKVSTTYYAEVGEPGQKRSIKDKAKLVEALGGETFLELASVSLADIDKYCSDAQKAEILEVTNDGARKFAIKKRV